MIQEAYPPCPDCGRYTHALTCPQTDLTLVDLLSARRRRLLKPPQTEDEFRADYETVLEQSLGAACARS